MQKVCQSIYFNNEVFVDLYHFMQEKGLSNMSQAINALVPEHKRFKKIAQHLEMELNKKQEIVKDGKAQRKV